MALESLIIPGAARSGILQVVPPERRGHGRRVRYYDRRPDCDKLRAGRGCHAPGAGRAILALEAQDPPLPRARRRPWSTGSRWKGRASWTGCITPAAPTGRANLASIPGFTRVFSPMPNFLEKDLFHAADYVCIGASGAVRRSCAACAAAVCMARRCVCFHNDDRGSGAGRGHPGMTGRIRCTSWKSTTPMPGSPPRRSSHRHPVAFAVLPGPAPRGWRLAQSAPVAWASPPAPRKGVAAYLRKLEDTAAQFRSAYRAGPGSRFSARGMNRWR